MDRRSNQPQYCPKPSLIQTKVLPLSLKTVRGEEASEENFEPSRGWFMMFKERCHLHSIEFQGEATNLKVEVSAVFQITLRELMKLATLHNRFSV